MRRVKYGTALTSLINGGGFSRVDKYRLDGTNSGSHGGIKARRILSPLDSCPDSHRACRGSKLGGVLSLHSEARGSHGHLYRHIFSTVHSQTVFKQASVFADL